MVIDAMVIRKWCTVYRNYLKTNIICNSDSIEIYILHVSDILQGKQIISTFSKFKIFVTFKIVTKAQELNYLTQHGISYDPRSFPNLRHLQKSLLAEMKLASWRGIIFSHLRVNRQILFYPVQRIVPSFLSEFHPLFRPSSGIDSVVATRRGEKEFNAGTFKVD